MRGVELGRWVIAILMGLGVARADLPPAPPLAPPSPAEAPQDRPRGDEPGPLDDEQVAAIAASARATPNEVTRREGLVGALAARTITGGQLVVLLRTLKSDQSVLVVVRAVAARVVDKQAALAYASRLRASANRRRYVRLLRTAFSPEPARREPTLSDPTRTEPIRPRCPRPIPCGIYCRWGYAKDENGCSKCGCLPNPLDPKLR